MEAVKNLAVAFLILCLVCLFVANRFTFLFVAKKD